MTEAILNYGKIKFFDIFQAAAVANEIFEEDCYNFAQIPAESIVLDVGGFHGHFAIRCAIEKNCRVMTFEPCVTNRAVLEQNLRLNNLMPDQVTLSPLAIGTPGRRIFTYLPKHPAGSKLETTKGGNGGGENYEVEVGAITDQLRAARRKWGATRTICLKLDCEGAEHEIFADYGDWIGQIHVVAMEWHAFDGAHFGSLLAARGFTVLIEGGGPKPRPLWDPTAGRWTWKGQPWGDIGAGLLFAERSSEVRCGG